MPLKLSAPIYKTFVLERTDEKYSVGEESTEITVKQAAQHEHMMRQDFFSTLERKFDQLSPDEVSIVQRIALEELKRLEVRLGLVECNIMDEKEKPLFPSKKDKNGHPSLAMTKAQFEQNWGLLPPDVAAEIHEKVLEVNLMWAGPEGEVN